jgi:hypothetical protein
MQFIIAEFSQNNVSMNHHDSNLITPLVQQLRDKRVFKLYDILKLL